MAIEKMSENLLAEKSALRILGVWDTKICDGSVMKPHFHRDVEEFYYILEGSGNITVGEKRRQVKSGDLVYIPPQYIHAISNTGKKPLHFITFSIYIGEESNTTEQLRYIR